MKNNNFEHLDDKSMAEDFVFPHELSEIQKAEADLELKRLRLLRLGQMSDKQRVYAGLLGLKYQIEDYLQIGKYGEQFSFGMFLKKYLDILGLKQKDFANEISLHPSKLNQIISGKVNLNTALVYRLERHSGGLIPATYWWNLHAKKVENTISNDQNNRINEAKFVKHALVF
jgi:plasmid maintenance system antidote protein VapI